MQLGMEFCYATARDQVERSRKLDEVSQAKSHEIYDLTTKVRVCWLEFQFLLPGVLVHDGGLVQEERYSCRRK